jgi:hypothetical protein
MDAMKATYTVTLPDGTKSTRKSSRVYTYAVAIFSRPWITSEEAFGDLKWSVVGFAASQAHAEKTTSRYKKWKSVQQIVVLPVAA